MRELVQALNYLWIKLEFMTSATIHGARLDKLWKLVGTKV